MFVPVHSEEDMATTNWMCYACFRGFPCKYIGPMEEFEHPDGHTCPKCGSEDVFPHRIFRCKKCGDTEPQNTFFGSDLPLDEDPVEAGWKGDVPHRGDGACGSLDWEQVG